MVATAEALLEKKVAYELCSETDPLLGKGQRRKGPWRFAGIDLPFFLQMVLCEGVIKGLVMKMSLQAGGFVFMEYHVAASTMDVYEAVMCLPIAFKPLMALLSDMVPICGWRKSPYVFIFSIPGLIAFFVIGFSPSNGVMNLDIATSTSPPWDTRLLVILCFCIVTMAVAIDVLMQGRLAQELNRVADAEGAEGDPHQDGVRLLYVFGLSAVVCALGATFLGALMLAYLPPQRVFIFCGVLGATVPIFAMIYGFGEPRMDPEKVARIRRFFFQNWESIFLSVHLVVGALVVIGVTLSTGTGSKAAPSIISAVYVLTVIVAFAILLHPTIVRIGVYFCFSSLLHMVSGPAEMYFMMDNVLEFPAGPHLSKNFVTLYQPLLGMFGGVVGITLFRYCANTWTLKRWSFVIILVSIPLRIISIAMISRWNVAVGIPDLAIVIFLAIVGQIVGTMGAMPFTFTIPRLCPPGMECTLAALLMGASQAASTCSINFSAALLQAWHVRPRGLPYEQDQFDNLPKVLWLGLAIGAGGALIVLPMLPNVGMFERLLDEGDSINTGSLFRRWTGRHGTSHNMNRDDYNA